MPGICLINICLISLVLFWHMDASSIHEWRLWFWTESLTNCPLLRKRHNQNESQIILSWMQTDFCLVSLPAFRPKTRMPAGGSWQEADCQRRMHQCQVQGQQGKIMYHLPSFANQLSEGQLKKCVCIPHWYRRLSLSLPTRKHVGKANLVLSSGSCVVVSASSPGAPMQASYKQFGCNQSRWGVQTICYIMVPWRKCKV